MTEQSANPSHAERLRQEHDRARAQARASLSVCLAAIDADSPDLPRLADAAASDASYVAGLARRVRCLAPVAVAACAILIDALQ